MKYKYEVTAEVRANTRVGLAWKLVRGAIVVLFKELFKWRENSVKETLASRGIKS